jgi:hypothetical protein
MKFSELSDRLYSFLHRETSEQRAERNKIEALFHKTTPNVEYWRENYGTLQQLFPGQYVAIYNRVLVSHNTDFEAVLEHVDKLNVSMNEVMIEHIHEPGKLYVMALGAPYAAAKPA